MSRLGLRIPEDLAVVGFDDFDMADMLQPALTVIRLQVEAGGHTAAEVLFQRLQTPSDQWPEQGGCITLQVDLTLRASCGCFYGAGLLTIGS